MASVWLSVCQPEWHHTRAQKVAKGMNRWAGELESWRADKPKEQTQRRQRMRTPKLSVRARGRKSGYEIQRLALVVPTAVHWKFTNQRIFSYVFPLVNAKFEDWEITFIPTLYPCFLQRWKTARQSALDFPLDCCYSKMSRLLFSSRRPLTFVCF